MPVHTNKIGAFYFNDIIGEIALRQEQVEVFERKGTDGVGLRTTGKRGRTFQLQTVNFVATYEYAKLAMVSYKALIGGPPQPIIRYTVSFGTFAVLDVVEVSAKAVLNTLGGMNPPNEVRQVCQWTLIG